MIWRELPGRLGGKRSLRNWCGDLVSSLSTYFEIHGTTSRKKMHEKEFAPRALPRISRHVLRGYLSSYTRVK